MTDKAVNSLWLHFLLPSLLIVGAAFLTYSNSFYNGFHLDDVEVLLEKVQIKSLDNLPLLLKGQRGVSMASFALNYAWGGFNVFGYHLVSVTFHALTGVLVFLLLVQTLSIADLRSEDKQRITILATFVALLFIVHPIQTQAVNYIVQRMEILASFFFLAALLLFVKGALSKRRVISLPIYVTALACFWLGLYSKEIAVTFPLIMFIYDYFFIAKGRLRSIVPRIPVHAVFMVATLYFSYKVLAVLGGIGSATEVTSALGGVESTVGFSVSSITWWEYLLTQFNVVLYYISLLLVPTNLNLLYDFPISRGLLEIPQVSEGAVLNFPPPPPIVSLLILTGMILMAILCYLRAISSGDGFYKVISFFILWFFIVLLPTSSIIPIADVIFEHRLYLPTAGYAVVFVLLLNRFFQKRGGTADTAAATAPRETL